MNKKLSFLILFIFTTFYSFSQSNNNTGFELLSPTAFNLRIQNKPGVLLDVRTESEQKKGIIKNAFAMDIFKDDFETKLNKLDKNKTYYVYCAAGGRSAEACEMMKKKGFIDVKDLNGGFNRWKKEGLPIEIK